MPMAGRLVSREMLDSFIIAALSAGWLYPAHGDETWRERKRDDG